jgi:hypothetical protein
LVSSSSKVKTVIKEEKQSKLLGVLIVFLVSTMMWFATSNNRAQGLWKYSNEDKYIFIKDWKVYSLEKSSISKNSDINASFSMNDALYTVKLYDQQSSEFIEYCGMFNMFVSSDKKDTYKLNRVTNLNSEDIDYIGEIVYSIKGES